MCVLACPVAHKALSTDVGHHAGQGLHRTRPPLPQLAVSMALGAAELRRFVQEAEPPLIQQKQHCKKTTTWTTTTTTTTTTTAAVAKQEP